MELSKKQIHTLRTLAHSRKPVVTIGIAGLTDAVADEIEIALGHHELIKIRINVQDREVRNSLARTISRRTGAELVQSIGHVATYFRQKPKDSNIRI